jgi:hypothetical protein
LTELGPETQNWRYAVSSHMHNLCSTPCGGTLLFKLSNGHRVSAAGNRDSEYKLALAVKTRFRVVSGNYTPDFELRDARWTKKTIHVSDAAIAIAAGCHGCGGTILIDYVHCIRW